MAAMSGLKPFEVDEMAPTDVWISVDAYELLKKDQWELERWNWYYTAQFGNRDPKKRFPRSPEKFHPLWFDEKKPEKGRSEKIKADHARMVEKREAALKAMQEKNING